MTQSETNSSNAALRRLSKNAPLFAALGDATRLKLLITLSAGEPHSITSLADNSKLSRQAIRKHLRILEDVGMVHGVRRGRENHFQFDPKPIEKIKLSLDDISRQWDQALSRLKSFVEEDNS